MPSFSKLFLLAALAPQALAQTTECDSDDAARIMLSEVSVSLKEDKKVQMMKGYLIHTDGSTEDVNLAGVTADITIPLDSVAGGAEMTDFIPACQGMIYQGADEEFWGMDLCTVSSVVMTETGVQIQFQENAPPLRPGAFVGSYGDHGEPFLWIHHKRWEDLAPTTASIPETPIVCQGLDAIALPPPSPPYCTEEDLPELGSTLSSDFKEDNKMILMSADITNDGPNDQEIAGLKIVYPVTRSVRNWQTEATEDAPADEFFAYCHALYIYGGDRWGENLCEQTAMDFVGDSIEITFGEGAGKLCSGCSLGNVEAAFYMFHLKWFDFDQIALGTPSVECVEAPVIDQPSFWVGTLPEDADDVDEEAGDAPPQDSNVPPAMETPEVEGCSQGDVASLSGWSDVKLKSDSLVQFVKFELENTGSETVSLNDVSVLLPFSLEIWQNGKEIDAPEKYRADCKELWLHGSNGPQLNICQFLDLIVVEEGVVVQFKDFAPELCPGCKLTTWNKNFALVNHLSWRKFAVWSAYSEDLSAEC
mmetsp:Transcript_12268/g.44733  ORF Transcript_12268/g.44733 Transcript_12268/m.44733 type:complete len:533 (+) Transcript_12268:361-1959(+)